MREDGSDEFNAVIAGRTDVFVSQLALTEAVSALARRRRQGRIGDAAVRRIRDTIVRSVEDGIYRHIDLTPDVHRRAEHLLVSLIEIPLRAADALHLALAMSARAASFASFDRRLIGAARAVGLATYPH